MDSFTTISNTSDIPTNSDDGGSGNNAYCVIAWAHPYNHVRLTALYLLFFNLTQLTLFIADAHITFTTLWLVLAYMRFEGVFFSCHFTPGMEYIYCGVLSFCCCITTSGVSRVEGRAWTSFVGLKCDRLSDIFVLLSVIFRHASQFLTRSRWISIQTTLKTGSNYLRGIFPFVLSGKRRGRKGSSGGFATLSDEEVTSFLWSWFGLYKEKFFRDGSKLCVPVTYT